MTRATTAKEKESVHLSEAKTDCRLHVHFTSMIPELMALATRVIESVLAQVSHGYHRYCKFTVEIPISVPNSVGG
jgi:hypothetical protein